MTISSDLIHEMELLLQFNLTNAQTGLKVHGHSASEEMIGAARRLYDKKLVDQVDGGYLTALGREAAEHVQDAYRMLKD